MSRVNLILGVILIIGFLFRETYSQCSGTKQALHSGNGHFQSPNYDNELGKAANCTWEFSSGGKEYMLVLTVVKLRLYFVVNGKKQCSGSYILKMNEDTVDCKKYVELPNAKKYCNVYYSSDTCNTKKQGCERNKQTSFPLQVTYESDGRKVASNSGTVIGFKIEYNYIECLSETTTAVSTPATSATEKVHTTQIQTTSTPAITIEVTTTPAFFSNKSNTDKPAQSITGGVAATAEESETTQGGGTNAPLSHQKTIIIAASGGGGLLLIVTIAMTVVWFCKRKRNAPATEEHELSKSTEVDQQQMSNSGTDDQSEPTENITRTNQKTESNITTTVVYDAPCQSEETINPIYSSANEHLRNQSENPSKVKVQSNSARNAVNQSKTSTENISRANQKTESNIFTTAMYDAPCQSEEIVNPLYSTANEHLGSQSEHSSTIKTQLSPTQHKTSQPHIDTCPIQINVGQSDVSYSVIPDNPSTVEDVIYDTVEHDKTNLIEDSVYDTQN